MNELSMFRLNLLRALYLLIAVGLGITLWPDIVRQGSAWSMSNKSGLCMLAAFSLMCALGVRYPLQMLPVLLWEAVWKTMWLILVALPAYLAGEMHGAMAEQTFAVGFVILVYAAVPWDYVYRHYVRKAGQPWRTRSAPTAADSPMARNAA
ncbi:MAG: hypothetical protein V4723_07110 [Pseudomonadota bacterium]